MENGVKAPRSMGAIRSLVHQTGPVTSLAFVGLFALCTDPQAPIESRGASTDLGLCRNLSLQFGGCFVLSLRFGKCGGDRGWSSHSFISSTRSIDSWGFARARCAKNLLLRAPSVTQPRALVPVLGGSAARAHLTPTGRRRAKESPNSFIIVFTKSSRQRA